MRVHRMLLAGSLSGIVALVAGTAAANHHEAPAAAVEACKTRSVEGSQYSVDDAKVVRTTAYEQDRYLVEVRSPATHIRCVVTAEGEIFSADEVEEG